MRRPRHFRTSSRNFAISAISRASSLVIRRASARLFLIVHISDREAVRVLYDEARIVVVFDESRAVGSVSQTFHFLDYGLKRDRPDADRCSLSRSFAPSLNRRRSRLSAIHLDRCELSFFRGLGALDNPDHGSDQRSLGGPGGNVSLMLAVSPAWSVDVAKPATRRNRA
jgi:hypothetical protein